MNTENDLPYEQRKILAYFTRKDQGRKTRSKNIVKGFQKLIFGGIRQTWNNETKNLTKSDHSIKKGPGLVA